MPWQRTGTVLAPDSFHYFIEKSGIALRTWDPVSSEIVNYYTENKY